MASVKSAMAFPKLPFFCPQPPGFVRPCVCRVKPDGLRPVGNAALALAVVPVGNSPVVMWTQPRLQYALAFIGSSRMASV